MNKEQKEVLAILAERVAKKQKKQEPIKPNLSGKRYLYFAYGSNLNMRQMKERCPDSVPKVKATLYNARLTFKTFADVIVDKVSKASTRFVPGAVYEISKNDMKVLDRYEGYPTMYKKVKCVVFDEYHNGIECFMYVMQPGVKELELPSEQYINCIYEGCQDWALQTRALFRAWEDTAVALGIEIESSNLAGVRK